MILRTDSTPWLPLEIQHNLLLAPVALSARSQPGLGCLSLPLTPRPLFPSAEYALALQGALLCDKCRTLFDGRSENSAVAHVARNGHSVDRVNLSNTFGLFFVLLLNCMIDCVLGILHLTEHLFCSLYKLGFALVRYVKLVFIRAAVLLFLHCHTTTLP